MGEHEDSLAAFKETRRDSFVELRKGLRSAVAAVLATGVEAGAVRTDMPLETYARLLLSMPRARNPPFSLGLDAPPSIALVADMFLLGARGARDADTRPETAGEPDSKKQQSGSHETRTA